MPGECDQCVTKSPSWCENNDGPKSHGDAIQAPSCLCSACPGLAPRERLWNRLRGLPLTGVHSYFSFNSIRLIKRSGVQDLKFSYALFII